MLRSTQRNSDTSQFLRKTLSRISQRFDDSARRRSLRLRLDHVRDVQTGREDLMPGGQRAAFLYSLIVTAKHNDIYPQAWLTDVLARIVDHPVNRIDELLPWNWAARRATALTDAPPARLSATMCAFCSELHERRRSVPVKISSRRTGSDLAISSVSDTGPTPSVRQCAFRRSLKTCGQNTAYAVLRAFHTPRAAGALAVRCQRCRSRRRGRSSSGGSAYARAEYV